MSKSFSVENFVLEHEFKNNFSIEDIRVGILRENHIIVTIDDIKEVLSGYMDDNIVICHYGVENTFELVR